MTVHELYTGKKMDVSQEPAYLSYSRIGSSVDFRFGNITSEDLIYLRRIIEEAENEILGIMLEGEQTCPHP